MKPLLRLIPYLQRYRRVLVYGFLAIVGSNVFAVFVPIFVGEAIDSTQSSASFTILLRYALLVVGTVLISGFFTFLTRQTIIVVSRRAEYDIRNDFLRHIQRLHLSYFQNTPTGDLMAHATNDINAVRNVLGPGIMYSANTFVGFVMIISIILVIDAKLTLLALIPFPFVSYSVYRLGKVIHHQFEKVQSRYSDLTTRVQENLSGIRVIKAYVREGYEISAFRSLSWDYLRKNMSLAKVQALIWPLMFMLTGLSLIIIIWAGGLEVTKGTMTLGTVIQFVIYLGMLTWPMIALGWVTNIFQRGAASMGRIARILDTQPEIRDTAITDPSIKTIRGKIEFRNITFYHKDTTRPALKNINLAIESGMTIAIVGYTGCGKTSLVNLIPRLYDVAQGQIFIDDIDIRQIPLEVLRSNIGFVPQETFLFSDTIKENIAFGFENHEGEGRIANAAQISQIAKDIEDFPDKYDTMIGERGITLSGGQKQRISIARALARLPRILILDDALSAVDTYTEEEILHQLRTVMAERTSIIISHRISTVKDADHIVVLDNGQIVERGNHDELIALGRIYAELHNKQLLEEELERL
ncbi:MAG: ABC transporter ATP-binding protein [Bacteroidota bacterium]